MKKLASILIAQFCFWITICSSANAEQGNSSSIMQVTPGSTVHLVCAFTIDSQDKFCKDLKNFLERVRGATVTLYQINQENRTEILAQLQNAIKPGELVILDGHGEVVGDDPDNDWVFLETADRETCVASEVEINRALPEYANVIVNTCHAGACNLKCRSAVYTCTHDRTAYFTAAHQLIENITTNGWPRNEEIEYTIYKDESYDQELASNRSRCETYNGTFEKKTDHAAYNNLSCRQSWVCIRPDPDLILGDNREILETTRSELRCENECTQAEIEECHNRIRAPTSPTPNEPYDRCDHATQEDMQRHNSTYPPKGHSIDANPASETWTCTNGLKPILEYGEKHAKRNAILSLSCEQCKNK